MKANDRKTSDVSGRRKAEGSEKVPEPPRRRSQEERTEEMKARLLDSSIKVLRAQGYSGFRVAHVADTAGVSRGAQLHHFPSKDSLVIACLEHVFSTTLQRSLAEAAAVDDDDDVLDRARANAENFFFSDDFLVALDILIPSNKIDRIAPEVVDISQRNRLPAEEVWIDRLAATGLDHADARDILWILWSVIRGHAVRNQIGRDPGQVERATRLTLDLLSAYAATRRKSP